MRTPKIIPDEELLYLFSILALVESSYEMETIRFEPNFFQKIKDNDRVLKKMEFSVYVSRDTKKMLLSCSYGYIQILGYNLVLRELLFPSELITPIGFIEEAINPARSYLYLEDFLKRNRFKANEIITAIEEKTKTKELIRFARLWNGSKAYTNTLIDNYGKHKDLVKDKLKELKDQIEYYSQAL